MRTNSRICQLSIACLLLSLFAPGAAATTNGSQFVGQSVGGSLKPGETRQVSVTMRNTGTSIWTRAGGYKLGTQNPQDNRLWTGVTRIYLAPSENIRPGQNKTFTFGITAPTKPGTYDFQWRMVHEGVEWFGASSANVRITVAGSTNAAQFVSQSVPETLRPNETHSVSVTMKNTGSSTWTRAGGYKLGTQNPQDNRLWTERTRVWLSSSESIGPGQTKTFSFDIKAPATAGTYDFQWRMVHEGVEWFGALSRNVRITVEGGNSTELPDPNHAMDFGYYFVEWKNPSDFDTARAEVNDYTNLYYAGRAQYTSDLTPAQWRPLLNQSLVNAVREGKRIHLALELDEPARAAELDDMLDVAAPYWSSVKRIEVADEPNWNRRQTENIIGDLRRRLSSRDLSHPPMGVVYVHRQPLPGAKNAANLDWIGIEAYVDPPGSSDSQKNVDALNAHIRSFKSQVPAGKKIVLVMMAYDRNGGWDNISTLEDLQEPVYLQAYNDPRVIAITMFAYSRAGGTRDHPELKPHHRRIGEKILGFSQFGDDAQFLSQSIPTELNVGETTRVSITLKNTGSTSWTHSSSYGLGSQNPKGNVIWTGRTRVGLAVGESIAPGQSKTFAFDVTAPTTADKYNFQWRMIRGGESFGDFTSDIEIAVKPDADVQPSFPIRGAFYYPWFPQAWDQRGIFPFTRYTPSAGYYDSADRGIIQQHIDAMEYGNIDVAIASWWGQGHHTDQRLPVLLDVTAGQRFRWAVYYEDEGFGNPSVSQIENDLQYLNDKYASDPSFFRVAGRFVVFAYGGLTDDKDETCEMVDRWTLANSVNAYIVLKVFPGYESCVNQPDGWHQYAPGQRADSQGAFSYTISPGFWLADKPQLLSRNLAAWYSNIRNMVASRARFQLVTTFNEWGEGTSVESADEWSSPSGYGDYLDALARNGLGSPPIKPPPVDPPSHHWWTSDKFDNLSNGALHRQNGWFRAAGRSSAVVRVAPTGGKLLRVDARPGNTIVMSKDVADQSNGRHVFSLRVMVAGGTTASMAKIEVNTPAGAGWNKKFQLFFGNSMRLNHGPDGRSVTFVSATEMGRWYHVQCEIDLDTGLVDVWIDGTRVADNVVMHPGPISSIALSGWDRPGSVSLDDLLGAHLE